MRIHIKNTKSVCPECNRVVDATVYAEGGKVYIEKRCPEHGEFRDVYWGDYEQYMRVLKYEHLGTPLDNPRTETVKGCPFDCGICPNHKSHTVLGIIDVTNRCNLNCPICFAHAGAAGYVYEPTLEQIREMMLNLRSNNPPAPALQLSGGEPTVREDLPEIVRMAKELGFRHVEVDSNGLKLAESVDYCRELREAGADTIYLQFDGTKPKSYIAARGRNLLPTKLKALENLRKAGFRSVVLVPTLVGGVNDDQIGEIIEFAVKNSDIVRCVNFQPVSITGRIKYEEREKMRITIPDLMRLCEEQTNGRIKRSDWYPVPTVVPLSKLVEAFTGKRYVEFSCHPHCGMATYIITEGDEYKPITQMINVDGFLEAVEDAIREAEQGHRTKAKLKVATAAMKYIPRGFLFKYLLPLLWTADYEPLRQLHMRMIMIGSMHFMDKFNFDLERVERCIIHYATPDGRLIPFCTYNNFHRKAVERKFSIPIEEWRRTRAVAVTHS